MVRVSGASHESLFATVTLWFSLRLDTRMILDAVDYNRMQSKTHTYIIYKQNSTPEYGSHDCRSIRRQMTIIMQTRTILKIKLVLTHVVGIMKSKPIFTLTAQIRVLVINNTNVLKTINITISLKYNITLSHI